MRSTWTEGAAGWIEHEHVFDAIFAPLTAAVLDAADLRPGHRVLDVGCGSGSLLEAAVAAGASPVGVDISAPMVEAARRRVPAAQVLVADAQTTDLGAQAPGAPFDRVVSRFGVMFFADPVEAFDRIRAASAPGAGLAFVCWRSHAENPLFTLGTDVLTRRLPPAEPAPATAPGPSSLADPVRVRGVLGDAGWSDVVLDPLDVVLDHGFAGTDGVEERLATILATTVGREARAALLPGLGADGWAALLEEVRAELRGSLVDGAVRLPAATWLVTARSR